MPVVASAPRPNAASYARDNTVSMTDHGDTRTLGYAGNSQAERNQAGPATFTNSILGVDSRTGTAVEGGFAETVGTASYTRDPAGGILAQRLPTGAMYYYLTDALGSVTHVTHATGATANSYGWAPFGEATFGSEQVYNPWEYTGAYDEPTNGPQPLNKIGLRYYQPAQQRWTQTDPLSDRVNPAQPPEHNPYTYVGCDPINRTDPTGASVGCVLGIIGSTLGAVALGIALAALPVVAPTVILVGIVAGIFAEHIAFVTTVVTCLG